ncbi:MAG: hypothetical protein JRD87_05645 [Deltaproteobacteria bacterium]|jgi:hypothetical protein|nr:hypothetical protein [Deltaproteobacteria bacterium]MBW2669357.1 hypothetical protein [Deltaproteobacteria bacterium]
MVDRKTLPVHLITHEKKIKSKPHVHCQNIGSATEAYKKRSLRSILRQSQILIQKYPCIPACPVGPCEGAGTSLQNTRGLEQN